MNYSVLVVEDELDQRRALIETVDWATAGFFVVGEAENGVEALDRIESLEPDLIFTDIRMPMISGLELAARVRELRPATQIVILSGYDSFEYARTAINYNIIRYLLKPISSAELSQELFDIHRRMEERIGHVLTQPAPDVQKQLQKAEIAAFLLPLLLGGETAPDETALRRHAAALGLPAEKDTARFGVLVSKFKDQDNHFCVDEAHPAFVDAILTPYLPSESLLVAGRVVTLVFADTADTLSNRLELPLRETVQTASRLLSQRCTIGVSRAFSRLSDCSDAYFQAITARRYTSDGAGEVRFIDDQEPREAYAFEKVEKSVGKLEQLLKVGEKTELTQFVTELCENNTPESANLLVVQILSAVYRVVSTVSDKDALQDLLSSNALFSRITAYPREDEMKTDLMAFCEKAKALIAHSQKRDSEILCDRAVQIIDEQYADETLSLTRVSNLLAVSPNYLSTLIKKTQKKNFITLLTERRMRAAHDLLLCSNQRILDIAEACGYTDQHYFSYCFKKFYGQSPNQVRRLSREESL